MNLVQLFKGFSDPVRIRIVHLLLHKGELCVCHITDALALPQSTVSRHLNTLKSCGLVTAKRRGKWVYYRMVESGEVAAIADLIRNSGLTDGQFKQDLSRLKDRSC